MGHSSGAKGDSKQRCEWPGTDPLMVAYHDTEWGVPQHNDDILFEYIMLDTAQAGLSWRTVLHKRENYRKAFDNFSAHKIAKYDSTDEARLLSNAGIIRNKLKIKSAIKNAQSFLKIQREFGSFDAYIWKFVHGRPIKNAFGTVHDLPAISSEAQAMSIDLRKRGFSFVGPTICYAFMQGAGLVNDHVISCFRYSEV